jgi:hypothetical protein
VLEFQRGIAFKVAGPVNHGLALPVLIGLAIVGCIWSMATLRSQELF